MSSRPIRSNPLAWIAVIVVVAAIAGGGYGLWYLFLRESGPAPVAIGAAGGAGLSATAAPAVAGLPSAVASSASSPAASASAAGAASRASLDGTWTVDTSLGSFADFTDSFVGYRVQEQLASIGAQTAVGRTPKVSGTITIAGTSVTAGQFTADLTALQSDDSRRDGQLRRQALETDTYPTATFTLTTPIDLGSIPADGSAIGATASGQLTIHGVTTTVSIPLQAKRSGSVIAVTGSTTIAFADYSMTKPSSFIVLTVDDHGILELQLLFTKQ